MNRKFTQMACRLLLVAAVFLFLSPHLQAQGSDKWNGSDIASQFAGGDGEEATPYQISSAAELAYLAQQVNLGNDNGGSDYSGKYFVLMNDIDLDNQEWTPIGASQMSFKGTFDGKGYQIQNLHINQSSGSELQLGLFGYVISGTIRNLGVVISEKGLTVLYSGPEPVRVYLIEIGGIAGRVSACKIENCYVTGGVISADSQSDNWSISLGGLVGSTYSTDFTNCYSTVDIYAGGTNEANLNAGGISGSTSNSFESTNISYCFSSGKISVRKPSNKGFIGGIVGAEYQVGNFTTISNCLAVNYKLITENGSVNCTIGRIMGDLGTSYLTPKLKDNYAYDNIIGEDLTNGTTAPLTGSNDATDKNGADWNWSSGSLPTGIFDNTDNWEAGTLPIMPKLKTTTGHLMANQPDVSIPYPLELAATTHGSISEKYHKTYAGKGTQVEIIVTPDPGYGLDELTYQPEGDDAITIAESAGHYSFEMPGKKVTVAAVFKLKPAITVANVANGSIEIDGNITAAFENDKVTFTATPDNDCQLDGLPTVTTTGGVGITVNSEVGGGYSFTMPSEAVTVSAIFLQPYTVIVTQPTGGGTFTATSTGGLLTDGANTIMEKTELTLASAPASGYRFVRFTADGAPVTSPYIVTKDVVLSAEFEVNQQPPVTPTPDPTPTPTVYHVVTLPAVEGATTDPIAGEYEVEAWSSFRFYLTLDKDYDLSEPVVTTDRGETIAPQSSDGAYIVKYVRSDVQISIDGVVKNPDPVANETIEATSPKVWAENSSLHIQAVAAGKVYVYTTEGKLQTARKLEAGEAYSVYLPVGVYLVVIGNERFKVVI